jgi:aminoglycoside phosphotransferase (APT) family kinase protein
MPSSRDQLPFIEELRRDGVISADARLRPLSGGVSSDVFLIEDGRPPRVVKRALPQLRVADTWAANVSRNEFEQRYLNYVSRFMPDSVPAVLAKGDGYFVMPYFDAAFTNWKRRLLAGDARVQDAQAVGRFLGRVHQHSWNEPETARQFDSGENFRQLRIDPYLLTVGRRYPEINDLIRAEVDRLAKRRECLLHGDFSPKNMLFSEGGLVVLDCEVACFGDPAFDLAFLTSHLLLKALYHAPRDLGLRELVEAFSTSYLQERCLPHDEQTSLFDRTSRLACLLLLARVDGKSPVEYLDQQRQEVVRSFTLAALPHPSTNLREFCKDWIAALELSPTV